MVVIDLEDADDYFIRSGSLDDLAGVPVTQVSDPAVGFHRQFSPAMGTDALGIVLDAGQLDFLAAGGAYAGGCLAALPVVIEKVGGHHLTPHPLIQAPGDFGNSPHTQGDFLLFQPLPLLAAAHLNFPLPFCEAGKAAVQIVFEELGDTLLVLKGDKSTAVKEIPVT